ncbi:cell division protein FtsZ [Candidatus Dojkabacteria bacterium]|nr:cell division protein FtsZ [Candidatus Dojkabacteria bacterium]
MLVTPTIEPIAKLKVIGLGGAGGNAVNTMISDYSIEGVEFMAFNSDQQALKNSLAPITLQLGEELTRGLGVGGDHVLGAQAAEESLDEIHEYLAGSDMVFLTAGMGGGTGTGSIPVVAGVSGNLGALTVAVVTKPFNFEGRKRLEVAEEGIAALKDKVDTLIVVPNQRLLDIIDTDISFLDAMKKVDNVLAEGVKSITSLVTQTGFINVDFADVKSVMSSAGTSLMGIGKAKGEGRAEEAARMATQSPLLDMSIEGATGVLFNVIGGVDMSMKEVDLSAELISDAVDPNANIIFGATIDESLSDEIVITIVATGFDETKRPMSASNSSKSSQSNDDDDSDDKRKSSVSIDDFDLGDSNSSAPEKPAPTKSKDGDGDSDKKDLEIPAFLRRGK